MKSYSQEFYADNRRLTLLAANEVVPYVMNLIEPKSAVDLGCANGTWLSVFHSHGVKEIIGVDAYSSDEPLDIPKDDFRVCDLEKPVELGRTFDLAISLEVADHLAPEAADTFVESLVRLAQVVLFSAAIPFQGGNHHVNEQWPQYWADRFAFHDYIPVDCFRLRLWDHPEIAWWYKQNLLIYARRDHVPPHLREAFNEKVSPLVHPDRYLATADLSAVPLRRLLRAIPKAFIRGLKRTFR